MTNHSSLITDVVNSPIWQEPPSTRAVWMTMIAICNHVSGEVETTVHNLSKLANVNLRATVDALRYLSCADPREEDQKNRGIKIRKSERGWTIIEYSKIKRIKSADEKRVYHRIKQQEWRRRRKTGLITPKKHELVVKDEEFIRSFYLPKTKEAIRMCHIMQRRPTTCWTQNEIQTFRELRHIEDEDLLYVEEFYRMWRKRGPRKKDGYFPVQKHFIRFLNSFRQEVMKAKAAIPRWRIDQLINGVNKINHRNGRSEEPNITNNE